MGGIKSYFTRDHRVCDETYGALEQAVGTLPDEKVISIWGEFSSAMLRHLKMEEEVLFPAFEEATGMHGAGPTMMMRMEHDQMRSLLGSMGQRVDERDFEGMLDQGDTLFMLIQQHNMKEEGMLYPMAEQHLSNGWVDMKAALAKV